MRAQRDLAWPGARTVLCQLSERAEHIDAHILVVVLRQSQERLNRATLVDEGLEDAVVSEQRRHRTCAITRATKEGAPDAQHGAR